MKCEMCNKNNTDIMLTIISENREDNYYICHDCMKKIYNQTKTAFNAFGMISDIANFINKSNSKVCSNCGTTYAEYLKNKKFGCSQCYYEFKEDSDNGDDAINKFANNNTNDTNDKIKNLADKAFEQDKDQYEALNAIFNNNENNNRLKTVVIINEKLKSAIKNEEYETAAQLRDELKKLENKPKISGEQ